MDETHHDLSITGDKGGSRSVTYHNPLLQRRGANRGVKSACQHVTGAYATTAAGEALPPFYIFDSSAKSEENFSVRVEWLACWVTDRLWPVRMSNVSRGSTQLLRCSTLRIDGQITP